MKRTFKITFIFFLPLVLPSKAQALTPPDYEKFFCRDYVHGPICNYAWGVDPDLKRLCSRVLADAHVVAYMEEHELIANREVSACRAKWGDAWVLSTVMQQGPTLEPWNTVLCGMKIRYEDDQRVVIEAMSCSSASDR